MQDKILKATYDPISGISVCQLATKWGVFEHSVKVKDEDKDIANKWDGIRFAEYLCKIDKFKAKGRAFQERANGVKHAYNVCEYNNKNAPEVFKTNPAALDTMMRQCYHMEEESKFYYNLAKTWKEKYPQFIEKVLTERRKFRENI